MENKTFDLMYYESHFHDGQCIMKVDGATAYLSENDDCYLTRIYPDDGDPCCRQLKFHPVTLRLIEEGCYLDKGYERIGVWCEYDQDGNLRHKSDYDQDHHPSKWNQIAALLKEKGVGYDDIQIIMRPIQPDGRGLWKLMVFRKPYVQEDITIDGVDGTVLLWNEKPIRSESKLRGELMSTDDTIK